MAKSTVLTAKKLRFWLENNLNVLFIGKHGVGKTSIVREVFQNAGLVYRMYSAATMDPWVDFIGVPKEKQDENGESYLSLVKPRAFQRGEVEAIFMDEFNRSHKKIRNAVMELLQFKSINDDKLPNLRVVWAAINPDDEDGTYDVESIDPAQLDRFHIHVHLPYTPSKQYFFNRFGSSVAETALNWWNSLPTEHKNKVSPRRLDYALQIWKIQGSLEDVLPEGSNIRKLRDALKRTPLIEELNTLYQNFKDSENPEEEVKPKIIKFLEDENNYDGVVGDIIINPAMVEVFVPCMPKEKISILLQDKHIVKSFFLRHLSEYPEVTEVITQIVESNTNKSIAREFNRSLQRAKAEKMQFLSDESPVNVNRIFSYYDKTNNMNTITFGETVKNNLSNDFPDTYSRKLAFDMIENNIPKNLAIKDARNTLLLLDGIIRRSHNGVLKRFVNLMGIVNHCVSAIVLSGENLKNFRIDYVHLSRWVSNQPDFYFQVI